MAEYSAIFTSPLFDVQGHWASSTTEDSKEGFPLIILELAKRKTEPNPWASERQKIWEFCENRQV